MLLTFSCQIIIWITIMWMMNAMIYVAQGKLRCFTIDTITVLSSDLLAQMYVVVLTSFSKTIEGQNKLIIKMQWNVFLNETCQK